MRLTRAAMLIGMLCLEARAEGSDDPIWHSPPPTWQSSAKAEGSSGGWTQPSAWSASPLQFPRLKLSADAAEKADSRPRPSPAPGISSTPPQVSPRSMTRLENGSALRPSPLAQRLPPNAILPSDADVDRRFQLVPDPDIPIADRTPLVQVEKTAAPESRGPAAILLPPVRTPDRANAN